MSYPTNPGNDRREDETQVVHSESDPVAGPAADADRPDAGPDRSTGGYSGATVQGADRGLRRFDPEEEPEVESHSRVSTGPAGPAGSTGPSGSAGPAGRGHHGPTSSPDDERLAGGVPTPVGGTALPRDPGTRDTRSVTNPRDQPAYAPEGGSRGRGSSAEETAAFPAPQRDEDRNASPGYGAPAYSAAPEPARFDDRTAVFPAAQGGRQQPGPQYAARSDTPAYAPTGYPQPYSAQNDPPRAPTAQIAAAPAVGSRVTAVGLGILLGLVLSAAGVFLLVKYGLRAEEATAANSGKSVADLVLGGIGALLLMVAVALNGWSAWSTVLPGLALTGLGGWAFISRSGLTRITSWTNFAFKGGEIGAWHGAGFTLLVGLLMLGSSVAAGIARRSGRNRGAAIAAAADRPAPFGPGYRP